MTFIDSDRGHMLSGTSCMRLMQLLLATELQRHRLHRQIAEFCDVHSEELREGDTLDQCWNAPVIGKLL